MKMNKLSYIIIVISFGLLSACSNDSSEKPRQTQAEKSDSEIDTLEPYLEEPYLETHINGERKMGIYFESNGQGKFQDCKSGHEYTLDADSDTSQLHSSYQSLIQTDGQKLIVELIGEPQTAKTENKKLAVQKLIAIIHLTSCP